MQISPEKLAVLNQNLRYESPSEIISFVMEKAQKPLVTTSFGTHSAALLHAVTDIKANTQVVWCDTGYNTAATYSHAQHLIETLSLKIDIVVPDFSRGFLDSWLGVPLPGSEEHKIFSEIVKLKPFRKALKRYQPDVWFTNLRKSQTEHRKNLDVLTYTSDGILKACPFFHFDDAAIEEYMAFHNLPTEPDYVDPVKAFENRECGIHLSN